MRLVRRVVIVVFDGLQALDAAGPAEVFSQATRLAEPRLRRRAGRAPGATARAG